MSESLSSEIVFLSIKSSSQQVSKGIHHVQLSKQFDQLAQHFAILGRRKPIHYETYDVTKLHERVDKTIDIQQPNQKSGDVEITPDAGRQIVDSIDQKVQQQSGGQCVKQVALLQQGE